MRGPSWLRGSIVALGLLAGCVGVPPKETVVTAEAPPTPAPARTEAATPTLPARTCREEASAALASGAKAASPLVVRTAEPERLDNDLDLPVAASDGEPACLLLVGVLHALTPPARRELGRED